MKLTKGKFSISHDVMLEVNSTTSSNGFILGDGIDGNDVALDIYPGAALHCIKGHLVVDETDSNFFSLSHGNAKVIRKAESTIYINQDLTISNLIIDTDTNSAMIVTPGKNISYSNCVMETSFADFTLTGQRGNDYVNFLMGDGDLFMHKGTLPAYTYIWNTNNTIRGSGNISGAIVLQNSAAEAKFDLNGDILTDVTLNAGTVTLDNDLHLTQDNVFAGAGKVVLSDNSLYLGSQDKTWTGSIYWDGNYGRIHMNSRIDLSGTWTFSGSCVINGNWNVLELLPSAEIIVEKGSTLLFKETRIKNLSGNQIRCVDDTGIIKFYDSKVRLDGNYSFTMGSIKILEEFEVRGTYTFDYQSTEEFVVTSYSSFKMKEDSTFSYNPQDGNKNLFILEDLDSTFEIDNATLHAKSTGMQLKTGIFRVFGDSYLSSNATTSENGIIFGDGLSSSNDVRIDIEPEACLKMLSGYIVDKSVD
jgi:hypothetical protein